MIRKLGVALAAIVVLTAGAGAADGVFAPSYPVVAPDGAHVAWVDGSAWQIWEAAPDGSGARVVAPAPTEEGISDLLWTKQGLVVDSNFTLYLVRPGEKPRELQPAGFWFAAGGTRVASGPDRGPGRAEVTDVVTGRHWRLGSPKVNNSSAALSPDGTRVAWTASSSILIGKVGGVAHRLAAKAAGPVWSPDGRWLTFVRSPNALRLISSSGGRSRLLPVKAGRCQQPAWSPDSASLACPGLDGLSVVNLATGAVRHAAPGIGNEGSAAWAPDGSALYVTGRPIADVKSRSNCLDIWRLDPATLRGPVVVQGCPA